MKEVFSKIRIEKFTGPINECIDAYMESLRSFLLQFLAYQREHPDMHFSSSVIQRESLSSDATSIADIIWNSFSSCCFWPDSGEEIFIHTLDDKNPHVMMRLNFQNGVGRNDEFLERFEKSSACKKFVHVLTYYQSRPDMGSNYYYIDCGKDLEIVLTICRQILMDVFYDVELGENDNLVIAYMTENKFEAQNQAKASAQDEVLSHGMIAIRDAETLNENCTLSSNGFMEEGLRNSFQDFMAGNFNIELDLKDLEEEIPMNDSILISPEAYEKALQNTPSCEDEEYEGNYISLNECVDVYMTEIQKFLQKSIEYQRKNSEVVVASNIYILDCHFDYYSEDDWLIQRSLFFTNCCFLPNNGEEVFEGSLHDGKVHLMGELHFREDNEKEWICLNRFMKSFASKDFVHIRTYNNCNKEIEHSFYRDYGTDIESFLITYKRIFADVYSDAEVCGTYFLGISCSDKDEAQKIARKCARNVNVDNSILISPEAYEKASQNAPSYEDEEYEGNYISMNECVDVYMTEIRNFLQKSIEYQCKNSELEVTSKVYNLHCHPDYYSEDDSIIQKNLFFTNCCFLPNNGEEVFEGSLHDGNVHLMTELHFSEDDEKELIYLDRFIKSYSSEDFVHIRTYNNYNKEIEHSFYRDYGTDIESLLITYKRIFADVYNDAEVCGTYFLRISCRDKNEAQKEAQKNTKNIDLAPALFSNVFLNAISNKLEYISRSFLREVRNSPEIRVDVSSYCCSYNLYSIFFLKKCRNFNAEHFG